MIGTFVPSDIAVRNAIRDDVGQNLCVEAGAGTGKTTVLVDRIITILRTGHARVDQLAVITFTEKAAAELSGRVRQGLEDALALSATDQERTRLAAAILGLNHAHIETIHAFAAGLLRERPIEARLDPGFKVLDDLPSKMAFDAAYSDWLTEQMAIEPPDGPPAALVNALNLGLKFELVREAAERLNRYRDVLPLAPYVREGVNVDRALAEVHQHVDALRAMSPRMIDDSDPAYLAMQEFSDMYDGFVSMRGEPESLRRSIATTATPSFSRGHARRWQRGADCATAKATMKAIVAVLDGCTSAMRHNAIADLVEWLSGFVAYYEERRRMDGTADFDDLLIWARNLVRDEHEVRRYFHGIYTCVLVDEFQDTDPIQAEMIVRLCEEGDPAPNWREARLRDGSLFVVGDPKQSIYRFRRADITMYDDVKRNVFGDGVREIVQNFRSSQPIIDWVNRTFARLFVERPGVQARYIGLEHHPEYASAPEQALTLVRGVAQPASGKTAAADLRRSEAGAIATIIAEAVRDRSWSVRTAVPGEARPATYRDIAILIPTRSQLYLYEEALASAEVPYRHEGGRTFFARQEVRELIALLRAIDDPSDQVAAVASLRSAAFGCSDEELLLYRGEGGRFSHANVPAGSAGIVPDALRTLRALAELRFKQPLPELVRSVLDQTRLIEFAMLQPQGEQVAANLLKLIDHARAFAAAQPGGLRGFVRWLKEHTASETDATDAEVSEDTDDVVRIVTVHASKGLEFPIVVFANMNTERVDRTNAIADRRDHVLHMKLGKRKEEFRTPGYDDAEVADKEHGLAEELRLLYVAATRARDRLVVPFFTDGSAKVRDWDANPPKCLNEWLRSAGADEGAIAAPEPTVATDLPVWRRPMAAPAADAAARIVAARAQWQRRRKELTEDAQTPLLVVTASSLKASWEPPFAEDDRVRRGRAAEFGSAVHTLLERADLHARDGAHIDAIAAAVAAETGMSPRAGEMATIARNALGSAVMQRVRQSLAASRRVLPEVAFSVPAPGGGLAEGRIDLLFEEDGAAGRGLVVVDYKTDDVTRAEADIRANALYHQQAQVYAWAAQRATGLPVREVVFLFARIPHETTITVDAEFIATAEALIRTAALDVLG